MAAKGSDGSRVLSDMRQISRLTHRAAALSRGSLRFRTTIRMKRERGADLSYSTAAPATVGGERRRLMPLGQPGKARQIDDPRARRPAEVITLSRARGAPWQAVIPPEVTKITVGGRGFLFP